MQLQPGLQYGAAGPSGMYPPAGQYIPMPQQQQNEQLRLFWLQQQQEIQQVQFPRRCFAYIIQGHVCAAADCPKCTRLRVQVGTDPAEFKNHQLPLARIKKVRDTTSVCTQPCEGAAFICAYHWHGEQRMYKTPFSLAAQIMKSDEDVRMISAEAPVLFAKV